MQGSEFFLFWIGLIAAIAIPVFTGLRLLGVISRETDDRLAVVFITIILVSIVLSRRP